MKAFTFDLEEKRILLRFAREVIAAKLRHQAPPPVPDNIPLLAEQGACFVTLHTADGNLRGCIGNINAIEALGENISHNAENAAFNDPRFQRVGSLAELESLVVEISVLTPMAEIDSPEKFEVGKHGIVMMLHGRSAVFLPQVAPEQGWDRATTLEYLGMKAGLPRDAWKDSRARFFVFEAIVFSENEQAG